MSNKEGERELAVAEVRAEYRAGRLARPQALILLGMLGWGADDADLVISIDDAERRTRDACP